MIQLISNFDPGDMSTTTIEKLFYRQVKDLTKKTAGVNTRMKTFDMQFSDCWL